MGGRSPLTGTSECRAEAKRRPLCCWILWARLLASGLEAGRAVIRSILLEFIDGPKERMTAPRDGFLPLPFKPAAVRWPRCASLLRSTHSLPGWLFGGSCVQPVKECFIKQQPLCG